MDYNTAICIALIGGGTTVLATPLALLAFGFGASGVVAGSAAASIQSAVYGGATGGLFGLAQSVGAAGLAGSTYGGAATSILACAGILASQKQADEQDQNGA